jgi:hypothetical protein
MKYEFIFLCLITPGPKQHGKCLGMFLQAFIEELKQLWTGVEAYDGFRKQTSSCEQRICFRSMMALHMVFSRDGAHMASYGVPYVGLTLVVLDLVMVVKYVFYCH